MKPRASSTLSLPALQNSCGSRPSSPASQSSPIAVLAERSIVEGRDARRMSQRELAALETCYKRQQKHQVLAEKHRVRMASVTRGARQQVFQGCSNQVLKEWAMARVPEPVAKEFKVPAPDESSFSCQQLPERLCAFIPTPDENVSGLLSAMNLGQGDTFYDLGCGDGRVVIAVAKQFGCRSIGVDLSSSLIRNAKARAQDECGESSEYLQNILFLEEDITHLDLGDANAVFIYMPLDAVHTLVTRVLPLTNLQAGALIYTYEHWIRPQYSVGRKCHFRFKCTHWESGIHCYEWLGSVRCVRNTKTRKPACV